MFLGTGAVATATRFCQDAVHRAGLTGDWASFATLATAVSRALLTRANPSDETRIDRPYPIGVTVGNVVVAQAPQLLLLATTLDRLILGTRPFWGVKREPIRLSLLPYPVPSISRWLRGRAHKLEIIGLAHESSYSRSGPTLARRQNSTNSSG